MKKNAVSKFGVVALVAAWLPLICWAQVKSGSDGSDGAFSPVTNVVVNMTDHPNGVFQYTSVMISNGVTVTFVPNANNAPVVWLVQADCVINGRVDVSGPQPSSWTPDNDTVQSAGPGGYRGGNGGTIPSAGLGPGGGSPGPGPGLYVGNLGGNGSFGTVGGIAIFHGTNSQGSPGASYGNVFLVPLVGGSGGAGGGNAPGGGGGGGLLIAASGTLALSGSILANGASSQKMANCNPGPFSDPGGAGSGGGVRLVASRIVGNGVISAVGGWTYGYCSSPYQLSQAGEGRVRIDTLDDQFSGFVSGSFTRGFQPIIIPGSGQGAQVSVTSIGGITVSASPGGILSVPDAVLSAQQSSPMPVVVNCSNLPLHSLITVSLKPMNGPAVNVTCYNDAGTLVSSTATVLVNIPRGGGIVYATAATSN